MHLPKVSFVIPSHNCAAWLPMAVKSAFEQTHKNVEVVVIDDASTDSTPKVLEFLKSKYPGLVVHRNEKNLGRSASRNLGNEMSSGEFIFVLDADDLAYPSRVKLSLDKLKKADFVYGASDQIDSLGQITGKNDADVFDDDLSRRTLLNFIVHSTAAYTKELAQAIKYRDSNISDLGIDDWAFEIEARKEGFKFDHIPQTVGAYRNLSSGISKTRDQKAVKEAKESFLAELGAK